MEDIVLVYRTRRGEDVIILEPEVTQIDLSYRHISEIDLSPLSQCRHLEVLDLSSNLLQALDLWPLMRCKKLSRLILRDNPLTHIDVTPLFACPMLSNVEVDPTVEIEAHYELGMMGRRPRPLDGLRRRRAVKWSHGEELDPLRTIEEIKNKVYAELSDTFRSPDNAQVVDETLKFRIVEEVERAIEREMSEAEKKRDYKRLFILERGLDYIRTNMPT
ncbi:MAG: hypothetical protein ACP6IT_02335 [Candidatus Thorarchaeota archaeon]